MVHDLLPGDGGVPRRRRTRQIPCSSHAVRVRQVQPVAQMNMCSLCQVPRHGLSMLASRRRLEAQTVPRAGERQTTGAVAARLLFR